MDIVQCIDHSAEWCLFLKFLKVTKNVNRFLIYVLFLASWSHSLTDGGANALKRGPLPA